MTNTRPRLGELLLATGVCSREQLREAWEQKVLYGDRLGTNLLSLGRITEQQLANALGQQHGVHSGWGRVISPDKNALKLVPKTVAVRRFVVPHHVAENKQLFLMMRDPHDPIAVDEAAFAANMRVIPVVVCEARLWQLLEIHYHQVMSLRPVPLDGVVRSHVAALDDAGGVTNLGPELTSEEEFQRLYAGIHSAGIPAITPAARDEVVPPPITPEPINAPRSAVDDFMEKTSPARPLSILAERDPAGEEGLLAPPKTSAGEEETWRDTIEKTQPMMAKPRLSELPAAATAAADDDSVHGPIIDLVEVTESSQPAFRPDIATAAPAAVDLHPPIVRQQTADFHIGVDTPAVVDESPLSFADASKLLAAATDRTDIARIVLRAARTKFARAALFSVFNDRLVGWMGLGEGVESERMRDIVMKRGDKSVFAQVADNRSHFLGPLPRSPVHGQWVKRTARKIPKSVALFPILVRGRPVNVLYVDNGHDQSVDGGDVGEVLILAQQIAKSYETLLTSA